MINKYSPFDCRHNRTLPQIHPNGLVAPGAVLGFGLVPGVDLDDVGVVVGDQGQKRHTGYLDPARRQAVWRNGSRALRLAGGSMWNVVDPAEIEPVAVLERNDGSEVVGATVWTVGQREWEARAEHIVVVAW